MDFFLDVSGCGAAFYTKNNCFKVQFDSASVAPRLNHKLRMPKKLWSSPCDARRGDSRCLAPAAVSPGLSHVTAVLRREHDSEDLHRDILDDKLIMNLLSEQFALGQGRAVSVQC